MSGLISRETILFRLSRVGHVPQFSPCPASPQLPRPLRASIARGRGETGDKPVGGAQSGEVPRPRWQSSGSVCCGADHAPKGVVPTPAPEHPLQAPRARGHPRPGKTSARSPRTSLSVSVAVWLRRHFGLNKRQSQGDALTLDVLPTPFLEKGPPAARPRTGSGGPQPAGRTKAAFPNTRKALGDASHRHLGKSLPRHNRPRNQTFSRRAVLSNSLIQTDGGAVSSRPSAW